MPARSLTLRLADEAATAALGASLAEALLAMAPEVRRQGCNIGLMGDLGAGKTSLVRALLRRAGVAGAVKSPTYALLEPYELSRLNFYHFDFYRFKVPEEFQDRGFAEYFGRGAVCLVEWPERAAGVMPPIDLSISLQVEAAPGPGDPASAHHAETGAQPARNARLLAGTEIGERCLQELTGARQSCSDGA